MFFCFLFSFLGAQKVDSVKMEQSGDLIKIKYKIINSTNYQVFRVTVSATINGGLESKLKSLSGDYGENVVGGRQDYMVLWDVLKDVDDLKTVDFSVKAELVKDETPKVAAKNRKKGEKIGIHLIFTMDSKALVFGPRLGYMKNWGVSAGMLQGTYISTTDIAGTIGSEVYPVGSEVGTPFSIYSIDVTKRLANKEKFQLHLLTGFSFGGRAGDRYADFITDYEKNYSGINLGLVMDYGLLSISLEGIELSGLDKDKMPDFLVFGLGVRF